MVCRTLLGIEWPLNTLINTFNLESLIHSGPNVVLSMDIKEKNILSALQVLLIWLGKLSHTNHTIMPLEELSIELIKQVFGEHRKNSSHSKSEDGGDREELL